MNYKVTEMCSKNVSELTRLVRDKLLPTDAPAIEPVKPKKAPVSNDKITYAQALASSAMPHGAILDVNIMGSPENILSQVRKDDICADAGIKSIKAKGKTNSTIECASAQMCRHAALYQIQKRPANSTDTKTDSNNPDEFLAQLKEQKVWICNMNLNI